MNRFFALGLFFLVNIGFQNYALDTMLASIGATDLVSNVVIGKYRIYPPLYFSYLYVTEYSVIPHLLKGTPTMIAIIGLIISLLPLYGKQFFTKERLTSSGSAKWAEIHELKEKGLLYSPYDETLNGVICGVIHTGLINYETMQGMVSKFIQPFYVRPKWFITLANAVAPYISPHTKDFFKRYHMEKELAMFYIMEILDILGISKRYYIVDPASQNTHLSMVAPSRSGKGVGIIIPTLLTWKKSVIVFDLKGENALLTAGYRKHVLGQEAIIFAPTDEKPTYRFNPLNEVRWGTPNEGRDVENIMNLIVGESKDGKDDHWLKNAKSLLVGAVTFLKYDHAHQNEAEGLDPTDPKYIETNLYHVYEFLTNSFDKDDDPISFKEKLQLCLEKDQFPCSMYVHNKTSDLPMLYLNITEKEAQRNTIFTSQALEKPKKHPVVASSFSSFIGKPDNEGGSILSTAVTAVSLFAEKIVADNTSKSDFILGDIRRKDTPTSLYLVMPPSDVSRAGKLFKLIVDFVLLVSLENEERSKREQQTLFLLDEFPAFGNIQTLVTSLGYIASYGFKTLVISQGLEQLKSVYKDLSILTNCTTQIYFAPKDETTPKRLSDMLGKETLLIKQKSKKFGFFETPSFSYQEKGRELLTQDEAMVFKDSVMIIEGLTVRSPKNKFYISDDMMIKRSQGERLDPNHLAGLRS